MRLNHKQTGSMIVLALFVMVILGLLGLALAKQLRAGSQNVVYDVLGARAVMSAQSGLDHISSIAYPLGTDPALCNQTINSPASFSTVNGLQLCSYVAQCQTRQITDAAGDDHYYYQFSSTGTCAGGGLWTSRTIEQDGFVPITP